MTYRAGAVNPRQKGYKAMTIKTLAYIHNLMKEEFDKRDKAYKWMKEIANDAEEKEQGNTEALKEQVRIAYKKRDEALNALIDFEKTEY